MHYMRRSQTPATINLHSSSPSQQLSHRERHGDPQLFSFGHFHKDICLATLLLSALAIILLNLIHILVVKPHNRWDNEHQETAIRQSELLMMEQLHRLSPVSNEQQRHAAQSSTNLDPRISKPPIQPPKQLTKLPTRLPSSKHPLRSQQPALAVVKVPLRRMNTAHSKSVQRYFEVDEDERHNWITREVKKWKDRNSDNATKRTITIPLRTIEKVGQKRKEKEENVTLIEDSDIHLYYKYVLSETLDEKLMRLSLTNNTEDPENSDSSTEVTPTSTEDDSQHKKPIVITTATHGFRNFLYNWMCSIKNMEKNNASDSSSYPQSPSILDRTLIYTTDSNLAWELVSKRRFFNVFLDYRSSGDSDTSNSQNALSFGTLPYQRLIMYRTIFINQVLQLHNSPVLLADNDAVWLRDPFPIFNLEPFVQYDLLTQNDGLPGKPNLTCGGFLYMRNTPGMKSVWSKITHDFAKLISNSVRPQSYMNEQEMLPKYDGKEYRIGYLPQSMFPSGYLYFRLSQEPRLDYPDVYVVHNNFAIGSHTKVTRFQKYPQYLWQVDKDLQCTNRIMPDLSKIKRPPPPPPSPVRHRSKLRS